MKWVFPEGHAVGMLTHLVGWSRIAIRTTKHITWAEHPENEKKTHTFTVYKKYGCIRRSGQSLDSHRSQLAFVGRYLQQQNLDRHYQLSTKEIIDRLTGIGSDVLSFRSSARSADPPMAVAATYSINRRLWSICTLNIMSILYTHRKALRPIACKTQEMRDCNRINSNNQWWRRKDMPRILV